MSNLPSRYKCLPCNQSPSFVKVYIWDRTIGIDPDGEKINLFTLQFRLRNILITHTFKRTIYSLVCLTGVCCIIPDEADLTLKGIGPECKLLFTVL